MLTIKPQEPTLSLYREGMGDMLSGRAKTQNRSANPEFSALPARRRKTRPPPIPRSGLKITQSYAIPKGGKHTKGTGRKKACKIYILSVITQVFRLKAIRLSVCPPEQLQKSYECKSKKAAPLGVAA
ncbi:MAG: hypothetical protein NTX59_10005 [Elusimicrobia bacterium]|nr:hypothetical protein [Elusimicrobiota bacterium]